MHFPLSVGDALGPLQVLRLQLTRDRYTVWAGDCVVVHVEPRRADCTYHRHAGRLGLWVEGPLDDRARATLDALHDRLSQADANVPRVRASSGTVYLIPGHIGTPADLSFRAVALLQSGATVFVEPGKEAATDALCTFLGIPPPVVAPLDSTALRVLLEAGEDVVIFGVNEGIPGFVDPGIDLDPTWTVRSIGGPSVLGTALMRLFAVTNTCDWRFSFLGALHNRDDFARLEPHLARASLPVFLFSNGEALSLLSALPDRPVQLLVALTRPDETVHAVTTATLPEIAGSTPIVVYLP